MNEIPHHNLAIMCKSCENKWSLSIRLSGNNVEPFATICDCGALIIGNFNFLEYKKIQNLTNNIGESKNKIYLTNGHFEILQVTEKEISNLPNLQLE